MNFTMHLMFNVGKVSLPLKLHSNSWNLFVQFVQFEIIASATFILYPSRKPKLKVQQHQQKNTHSHTHVWEQ